MADMHSDEVSVGEKHKQAITTIGIVGLDYCGSTLINNILSGLPGCIGVGETHWILDCEDDPNQNGKCTECFREPCPVFSDVTLAKLKNDITIENNEWWNLIGKSSESKFVISGDKRPFHYDRFGIPDKLLFLLKDPRAHIVSWAKRNFMEAGQNLDSYNKGEDKFQLDEEQFERALFVWLRDTRKHISWCLDTKKELAVVSLEYFVENDEQVLNDIAEWIGTDFDANALKYWETDLHYIGSNHSVKRLNEDRYFFKQVKRDRRWEDVLTKEQSDFILAHEKVNYQLNRLRPFVLGSQVLVGFD